MKRIFLSLFALSLFSLATFAASDDIDMRLPRDPGIPTASLEEYYDLMIYGVDRRPHQTKGRSDVIMIVHCEPGRLTLFSLPRDTWVPVRGRYDKINHAFAYGGAKMAIATIEAFLKFKVDNYIAVDFETFMKAIDTTKTLTDNGRLIGAENFLASGENLLTWLRFRGYAAGDRRRCQRHQLFILRVLEYTQEMFKNKNGLFEQCTKAGMKITETDMTYDHVNALFEKYKNIDLDNDVERFVLPGTGKAKYETVVDDDKDDKNGKDDKNKKKLKAWYYEPKYNYALGTYIMWYRKNNMKMNYREVDTLRK